MKEKAIWKKLDEYVEEYTSEMKTAEEKKHLMRQSNWFIIFAIGASTKVFIVFMSIVVGLLIDIRDNTHE